ncbi:MAG: hypothetical protein U0514_03110 [Candidatus Andersenbacteria bacterium]
MPTVAELATLQHLALVAAGYVVGSARVRIPDRRLNAATHLVKAVGFVVVARVALGAFGANAGSATALVLLAAALAVLLGEAAPLPRLLHWDTGRGIQLATVVGLAGALVGVGWLRTGVLLATAVVVVALVTARGPRRAANLLPLIALVPIALQYAGLAARARQTSYVLLVIFLALDTVRVLQPAVNRWLASRVPTLLSTTERVRPLGASGAVTAAALLVHLLAPQHATSAALLGTVAIACANALADRWPGAQFGFDRPLLRGTARGFALYLTLVLVALLPVAVLLGGQSIGLTLLVAAVAWFAAVVPLPIDRYLLSPLAAGLVTYLTSR